MTKVKMDKIRQSIHDYIHDGYTDKASFESHDIVYIEGYQNWVMLSIDKLGNQTWSGPENNTMSFLYNIDDAELVLFYDNEIKDN